MAKALRFLARQHQRPTNYQQLKVKVEMVKFGSIQMVRQDGKPVTFLVFQTEHSELDLRVVSEDWLCMLEIHTSQKLFPMKYQLTWEQAELDVVKSSGFWTNQQAHPYLGKTSNIAPTFPSTFLPNEGVLVMYVLV